MKPILIGVALALTVSVAPKQQPIIEISSREPIEVKAEKLSQKSFKSVKKAQAIIPKSEANNASQTVKSSSRAKWLADLRGCESGGNYKTNTGNGFYGAYQFMISTWNTIAAKVGRPDLIGVRPDLASPADQDFMIIKNTELSAGLSTQNPGCYKKLGLSNKPPN